MTEEDCDRLERIVQDCKENEGELSDWERSFMQSWVERIEEYGIARVRVSEKQWDILARIEDKVSAR